MNKVEAIKQAKHPLDVLEDIYRYAQLGWEAIPEDDWDRMKWYGVFYRRTTPGYFMMRLRIPNGILSNQQLAAIAGIITDFGRDQADLTTRENIQLRWVTIEQVPEIFQRLEAVGLTTQQSGMDNMRNVVGCPIAGLDQGELLDASPLAQALQESFVGVRELSNLPRKFNVSITGCLQDCAHAQAHDVSFIPATLARDTGPVIGFNVLVGGALGGRDPRFATPLDAFVRPEEVVALNRAVLEVFRDHGSREARNKARMKWLLEEWGLPRFRAAVEERFGKPLLPAGQDETRSHDGDHLGVHAQRERGYYYVGLSVPVGRVTGTELTELARIAYAYGKGEVRLTPDQNMLIPHVAAETLDHLLQEPLLQRFTPFPTPIMRGLVSCTGIDYCHFSLIDTKGAALELARALDQLVQLDQPVRIHLSGCPNACGQHHLGDISLLGSKVRQGDAIVEAVDVAVGNKLGQATQFPKQVAQGVPLEELPQVVAALLQRWTTPPEQEESTTDAEVSNATLERVS